jgi:hypothetical protein
MASMNDGLSCGITNSGYVFTSRNFPEYCPVDLTMYKPNKSKSKTNNNASIDSKIQRSIDKTLKAKAEHKSFDAGFNSTVSSAGTIFKLTTIPQDDSDSGRDGDQLLIYKVQAKIAYIGADATQTFRMIFFRWNQDDTTPPVGGDLLQTITPYSPLNRDNERAKKFSIIEDYLVGTSNTGINIHTHSCDKKYTSKIAFQAASTTGTGHLYAYMLSDSLAVTHPTIAYVFRTYYYDF